MKCVSNPSTNGAKTYKPHHLPALIYGFSGGKKIFPATKESYRVYIGISSL